MTIYTGPHDFKLSTLRFPSGETWYDGLAIRNKVGFEGSWSYFMMEGLILDPTKTYTFELDFGPHTSGDAMAYFYSAKTTGTVEEAYSTSDQYYLSNKVYKGAPGAMVFDNGAHTVSATIGPGIESWADAMANGEQRLLFGVRPDQQITAVRLMSGTTLAGGVTDGPITGGPGPVNPDVPPPVIPDPPTPIVHTIGRITWGRAKPRYESGVSHGVYYPLDAPGVAWQGLVSVEDTHVGGEVESLYVDGVKFLDLPAGRNYQATLTAFSFPEEFAPSNGELEVRRGFILTRQPRRRFGLSYRTNVGDGLGYKIHLVYNALATPTTRGYRSLSNSATPENLVWTIDAVPIDSAAPRPTSHFIIDTSELTPIQVETIEGLLYGTEYRAPYMPTIGQIAQITTHWDPRHIDDEDEGPGKWTLGHALGDVHEIDVDGLFLILPGSRLSETTVNGIYQLTES